MNTFVRLTKDGFGGKNNTVFLNKADNLLNYISGSNKKEWYKGCYLYTKDHVTKLEETGSLAGAKDLTTNALWFDFDMKDDLNKAKEVTLTLLQRLKDAKFDPNATSITFSGNKGFHVWVNLNQELTRAQVTQVCEKLGGDLPGFDTSMYDYNQLLRIPLSMNNKSGLYAIPISEAILRSHTIEEIKEVAKAPDFEELKSLYNHGQSSIDPALLVSKEVAKILPAIPTKDIDWDIKPKGITNCRWALANGFFKEGERSTAFLILAATYKNQGYPIEIVYRMMKGVAEIQANRNNADRFPDTELYNNIVMQVFADTWNNGMYTCKKEGNYLFNYCKTLGSKCCKHDRTMFQEPHTLIEVTDSFKEYVKNIEQNTVKTGIRLLDDNIFITTGSNVGVLGSPGSGKSSLALNILNNTSKAGVHTVFASLDMARNRMYEKVMYNISGLSREDLYKTFKEGREEWLINKLKEEYGNVFFFNKSSPTVEDVRNYVLDCQEKNGVKIKLVMLDYFERVTSDISDNTAASSKIAGELQDLVNDLDIALITLVQPNKSSIASGADTALYDYSSIKGSSFVSQAFRQIISLWRPFYNPKDFTKDHYMQMAILKNDLGELNEFAFRWKGKTGKIEELDQMGYDELERLLVEKEQKKGKKESWD